MKRLYNASKPFLLEITKDAMMIICILAPILLGLVFKILVPFLENILVSKLNAEEFIKPYYIILDLLLALMTPIMFSFSGVLAMLEEMDNRMMNYYFVTPIRKKGYIITRLVVPSILAFFYDLLILSLFSLVADSFLTIIYFSLAGFSVALVVSLFVVAFAKNKLEGMTLVKLSGLLLLGLPIPYLVKNQVQYLFSFLPSFWLGKACHSLNYLYMIPTFFCCGIMIFFLCMSFRNKTMKNS